MLLDKPEEEIARDLMAQATAIWGAERAQELRAQIEDASASLSRIARYPLPIDGDEPDFLVAPAVEGEVD